MEIDYIKTHMIIERYVQGKLGADEEADFEERLVWDKALQEEVELAETLRSWLQASVKESDYQTTASSNVAGWRPWFLLQPGHAARMWLQPGFAAAASFILGIAITFSVLRNPGTDIEFGLDESAPSLVVPLIVTRTAGSDRQEIPVSPGAVTLLLIDVPYLDQRFNVVVRDGENEAVWQQDGLSAGYLDAVAVGVPGSAVPPGDYTLSIASVAADFTQEIPFRTVTSE